MPPRSIKTIEELQELVTNYLSDRIDKKLPITVLSFCVYCDICRDTFALYASGEYDNKNESYSDTLKRFKDKVEADKQDGLLTGKYNATGAIFDLKNNHGWKDKFETTTTNVEMTQEEWLDSLSDD